MEKERCSLVWKFSKSWTDGHPYKLLGPDKQHYLKPIDMLDAAAQRHDYLYDKAQTGGIEGALFDDRVYKADLELAKYRFH